MTTCIANAADSRESAVISCTKEATHVVREERSEEAALILGKSFTNHLMCEDHSRVVCTIADTAGAIVTSDRFRSFRLSNSHPAGQIIVAATMATTNQRTSEARRLVKIAQAQRLACYSCHNIHLATEFDASTQLCPTCHDEAGFENEHSDTNGDHDGNAPVSECPTCREEAAHQQRMAERSS